MQLIQFAVLELTSDCLILGFFAHSLSPKVSLTEATNRHLRRYKETLAGIHYNGEMR